MIVMSKSRCTSRRCSQLSQHSSFLCPTATHQPVTPRGITKTEGFIEESDSQEHRCCASRSSPRVLNSLNRWGTKIDAVKSDRFTPHQPVPFSPHEPPHRSVKGSLTMSRQLRSSGPAPPVTSLNSASGSLAHRSSHSSLQADTSAGVQRTPSPMKDADADTRLRDRGLYPPPSNVDTAAFGGRRRAGKVDLGMRRREWIILGAVCVLGAFIRLWRLSYPTSVV